MADDSQSILRNCITHLNRKKGSDINEIIIKCYIIYFNCVKLFYEVFVKIL